MLRRVGLLNHTLVGAAVVGVSALAGAGVIGAGDGGLLRSEHFDAKQVTVTPAGDSAPSGVRIREVVDIDFGRTERRGYQRIIPNDFGEAIEVTATSPDANAELRVEQIGSNTRIRVGNPGETFTGQRRYVLEYTLPEARLDTGRLGLDVIGTDETLRTDAFSVVLAGFEELEQPGCSVGRTSAIGGCTFERTPEGWWQTEFALDPGDGVTVDGDFTGLDPAAERPPLPPAPERVGAGFRWFGLVMFGAATAAAAGVFIVIRRRGSNAVYGAGEAADAAFGDLPMPDPDPARPVHDVPTHRVTDAELASLATIEFVPPRGLEPWQGYVLLSERVDDDAVRGWFSEMIARGVITTSGEGKKMKLHAGPTDSTLSHRDRGLLAALFESGPTVDLGTYDEDFADLWERIEWDQKRLVDESGWWERPLSGSFSVAWSSLLVFGGVAAIVFHQALLPMLAGLGFLLSDWYAALVGGVVFVGGVAALAYRPMLASRTALGSALALRTESFRRFLEASEGRHVDWAWENGQLREYSAWAVALGAAEAWSSAIEASAVPDRDVYLAGPLVMHSNVAAFTSTTVKPSSSGSGGSFGGGGFGGGSVGGGGGGGSSGSW